MIPVAERAIQDEDPGPLVDLLTGIVREEAIRRFEEMMARKAEADRDGEGARAYVSAMLGLQVWAHSLAERAHATPHGDGHEHHG